MFDLYNPFKQQKTLICYLFSYLFNIPGTFASIKYMIFELHKIETETKKIVKYNN